MKVSVFGMGRVGATLAYTLIVKQVVDEIVLVGRRPEVAEGHAHDLQHALMFVDHGARISAGDAAATAGSEVIVYCASQPWKEEFCSRLEMARENTRLLEETLPALAEASPDAKLVMVSNPVDVLTWHAIRITGYAPHRVMGTGTMIDSARFRELVSEQVGIHPADIRAYSLGEHGDSQMLAMSRASAGGEPLEDRPDRREMFDRSVKAGIDVFRMKGGTEFATSMAISYIVEAILNNALHTMPLSVLIDGYQGVSGVCLSVPVVVGRAGVTRWLAPELDEAEAEAFRASANVVREAIVETLGKE